MIISCTGFHSRSSDRQWYVSIVHRTYKVGAIVLIRLSEYCTVVVHACIIHSTFYDAKILIDASL